VNAQFSAGSYEKFKLKRVDGDEGKRGIVALESVGFPGRFLMLIGDQNIVNVQGHVGACEKYEVLLIN
jgi:hypothetical protein